jgi:hypothetical protein
MTIVLRSYSCTECQTSRVTQDSMLVPLCGQCRGPMKFRQARWTNPNNHSYTGMRAPAIDFNQTAGRIAPIGDGIEINSLHDIRRIERESEKMARDGVGEQLIFRKYAQDRGNLHTHTMGPSPATAPSQEWLRKHGHTLQAVPGDQANHDTEMGPGAREELASALPDDPI